MKRWIQYPFLFLWLGFGNCLAFSEPGTNPGLPADENLYGLLAIHLTILENFDNSRPAATPLPQSLESGPFTGGKLGSGQFLTTSGQEVEAGEDFRVDFENWGFEISDWWQETDFGFTGILGGSGTAKLSVYDYNNIDFSHTYSFGEFPAGESYLELSGDFQTTVNKKIQNLKLDLSAHCQAAEYQEYEWSLTETEEACHYKGSIISDDTTYEFDQKLFGMLFPI